MLEKFKKILLFITIIFITVNVGCSNKSEKDKSIAYISANEGSDYQNTFEELKLGVVSDFDLKLTKANKSWVNIWVEGYKDGKAIEPFPLTKISYGRSPKEVHEGNMGFGIIKYNNKPLFFLYAPNVSSSLDTINSDILNDFFVSTWDYAFKSDETIKLKYGEEKLIGVYRQGKKQIRTGYNYQDPASVKQMIEDDYIVLLLKIKIEEVNE
ncbi:MAG: hypothetical protein FH761_09620 [Firmicutes bacterium]|nr:hypothetical protein [Bacillota bacterium]